MTKFKAAFLPLVLAQGCSSIHEGRIFLDSSTHKDEPPSWVQSTKLVSKDNGIFVIKTESSVLGSERVNGCFDLARLDTAEHVMSEIANDIKGSIDNAQQSISENAEIILGKVRSSEYRGRLTGLRFTDQYFERYTIADNERINCYLRAELDQADYNRAKRSVVDGVVASDPRLKEAITRKQIDFFAVPQNESSKND